jgi:hypothetical protein
MEMTQTVSSNPTETPHALVKAGAVDGTGLLATMTVDLKPERVQDSAGGADPATLSLQLAIYQSQTVILGFSGSGLAITFNGINNGSAAPAA